MMATRELMQLRRASSCRSRLFRDTSKEWTSFPATTRGHERRDTQPHLQSACSVAAVAGSRAVWHGCADLCAFLAQYHSAKSCTSSAY